MIALTPGDPAGIGPLVMLKAAAAHAFSESIHFCGHPSIWLRAAQRLSIESTEFEHMLDSCHEPVDLPDWGCPSTTGAQLAWDALDQAVNNAGDCYEAIVTGPISKIQMLNIGFPYPGHTEYLQEKFKVEDVLMVMWAPGFCVGLATVHIPLIDVSQTVLSLDLARKISLLNSFLQAVETGICHIGVCGLNPHAGENGALGSEEKFILRAITRAAEAGLSIAGPLPGDTAFVEMNNGTYQGVLAMYHDQGLAPFKLNHFQDGVNVTVGLPIIRTSPDHGTAFDIAKAGMPDGNSATAALGLALEMTKI